jgi:hypothetical protein
VTAATQARGPEGLHYLRTTNPLNPENLAVYPRRIGSNRPNPYYKPRLYDQLRQGLPVFENRHCDRLVPDVVNTPLDLPLPEVPIPEVPDLPPVPDLPGVEEPQLPPLPDLNLTPEQLKALIPDELLRDIEEFAFDNAPGGVIPAPPCRLQGPYDFGGRITRYPQVTDGRAADARAAKGR